MPRSKRRINIITLGCSKNLVDSEYLMQQLQVGGWEVLHDANGSAARIVVVNTCGFIADAQAESVNTILRLLQAKRQGALTRVYVMGCLSQRFRDELAAEMPEVDGYFGVGDLPRILQELQTPLSPEHLNRRLIATPSHYAYLKISEGCSWRCSFCAIPMIRGRHVSKPIGELVEQAAALARGGVRELMLIAQDSTYYGQDLYGARRLPELVDQLARIDGLEWLRIHYAYPAQFPLALLPIMRDSPKVCRYLDIPFQHIADPMLRLMRRGVTKADTLALIERIRAEVPGVAIRSTLLVGHPGETDRDFAELLEFVSWARFERLGVFTYSNEQGTPAALLPDGVADGVMRQRMEQVMELQRGISAQLNRLRVGGEYRVLIDRVEGDSLVGRTEYDSPEVDQEVIIARPADGSPAPGDFVRCAIEQADDYDLIGRLAGKA